MIRFLTSALKELDLFGSPIGLHMNNSFFYKTSFGGIVSIFCILFIFVFFSSSIQKFMNKQFIFVSTNKIYDPHPPISFMNSDRFMIALNVYQDGRNFIERPYFNITMFQGIYTRENGNQERKRVEIQLEQCTIDHWKKISKEKDFVKEFQNLGKDYLCPNIESQIYIEGMFASPLFSFIEIVVSECKNITVPQIANNRKWNPNCAPKELVQEKLKQNGFFGLSIFHNNYVLNIDQPQNYYTEFLNDKLYYTFVPEKMTKLSDVYFQDTIVQNDVSVLPIQQIQERNFLIQENNDTHESIEIDRKDGSYVVVTIRKSPYVIKIQRQYKKLTQLMSELGGFVQIIFMGIGIIMTKYHNTKFTMDLANKLYLFEDVNQQNKNKSNQKQIDVNKIRQKIKNVVVKIRKKDPLFIKYMQEEQERRQRDQEVEQVQQKSKKDFLVEQFKKLLMKREKVQLGISFYLSNLTFNLILNSKQNQYIKKATQLMHQDLDIINILDKVQQIEKIKSILFDKNQKKVFDFNEKPKIKFTQKVEVDKLDLKRVQSLLTKQNDNKKQTKEKLNCLNNQLKRSNKMKKNGLIGKKIEFNSIDSYKKLYNSYFALLNDSNQGIKKEINMRLINGLGEQMQNIFKQSDSLRRKNLQFENNVRKTIIIPFQEATFPMVTSLNSPKTQCSNLQYQQKFKNLRNRLHGDANYSFRNQPFELKRGQSNDLFRIQQKSEDQFIQNIILQKAEENIVEEDNETKGSYFQNIFQLNYITEKYQIKQNKQEKDTFQDVDDDD